MNFIIWQYLRGQELLASGDVGQVVADEDQVVARLPWEDMLPVAVKS